MTKSANFKILVVEDDAIIGGDIALTLEELGYEVVGPAFNIAESKEYALEYKPQLAILDIHLENNNDGIELGHWFNENLPVPIIFLTAYAEEKILDKAKEVHPMYYLLKPFTKINLKIAVEFAYINYYKRDIEQEKISSILRLNNYLEHSLTKSEIEVIKLLETGMHNKEIAQTLFVSENTIKTHLKNIFQKTYTKNRTSLIHKLFRG